MPVALTPPLWLLHFVFFSFFFSHSCTHNGDFVLEDELQSLVYVLHLVSYSTSRGVPFGSLKFETFRLIA